MDDINEGKEGMDDRDRKHVQQTRVDAVALHKVGIEGTDTQSRRFRQNKTLQRRSAVLKLASLTEEPSEGEAKCTSSPSTFVQEEKTNEEAAVPEAIVVTSRVVEFALWSHSS